MGDTYPFNDNKYAKKKPVRPETAEPLERIIHKIQNVCKKRGNDGFKGLSSMFRLYDSDGSRCLDQEELGIGLSKYGIQLSEDEIQTIFAAFDADSSGSVNLQELLLAIRPPMAPGRVKIVKQAFEKMDRTGDGVITQADLVEFYNIKEHPKFKSGQFTEEQCFKQFLDSFQQNSEVKDDKVTWDEFLDYYVGVSVNIDKDVYFDYMMRQSWKY